MSGGSNTTRNHGAGKLIQTAGKLVMKLVGKWAVRWRSEWAAPQSSQLWWKHYLIVVRWVPKETHGKGTLTRLGTTNTKANGERVNGERVLRISQLFGFSSVKLPQCLTPFLGFTANYWILGTLFGPQFLRSKAIAPSIARLCGRLSDCFTAQQTTSCWKLVQRAHGVKRMQETRKGSGLLFLFPPLTETESLLGEPCYYAG